MRMNLKTLLTFLTLLPLVSFEPITAQIPEPGPSVMRLPVFVKNEELRLSVADGFEVNTLVSNLDSPRWPIVLPNGNILISGSKTEALPNMPEETVRLLTSMNIFGKSPNTIIEIITNTNPPSIKNIIQDLNQPFGIVYIDESLYVANTDAIIKYLSLIHI